MPPTLWAGAVNTAVYILNRTGTSSVKRKKPSELWYGKESDLNILRVFGSNVLVHLPKEKRTKWSQKAESGIMVGYGLNVKGYCFWFPQRNKIETHYDIIFVNDTNEINNATKTEFE